jgi:hypothetical protein
MEKTFAKVEDLADHIKEYINIRVAAVKLNTAEKTSKLAANIFAAIIAVLVFVFFLIFASIALAFVFSKLTGEFYWGFLIVAGIYLLLALVIWLLRERLMRIPIMNAMLEQLFKDDEDGEED